MEEALVAVLAPFVTVVAAVTVLVPALAVTNEVCVVPPSITVRVMVVPLSVSVEAANTASTPVLFASKAVVMKLYPSASTPLSSSDRATRFLVWLTNSATSSVVGMGSVLLSAVNTVATSKPRAR